LKRFELQSLQAEEAALPPSRIVIVTLSLIYSDGSLIGVDAHLASQFHTQNVEVCTTTSDSQN
jgi:hypothetical protein